MKLTEIITFVIIAAAVAFFIVRAVKVGKGRNACSCCSESGTCGMKDCQCNKK